jgi:hypothetical protein
MNGAVFSSGSAIGGSGCGLAFAPGAAPAEVDAGPSDVACWSPGPTVDATSGSDFVASILDGPCSLVGTWDYTASAGAHGILSFDAYGHWVGGPSGTNLCSGGSMDGTYFLTPALMEFVTIYDCSPCNPDWWMGKVPSFDASCTHAVLSAMYDNCTGGRTEFNYDLTLIKR